MNDNAPAKVVAVYGRGIMMNLHSIMILRKVKLLELLEPCYDNLYNNILITRGAESISRRQRSCKGRAIIFLEGGRGGMRNLKKNYLQSLKRQNKLFAQLQNKN